MEKFLSIVIVTCLVIYLLGLLGRLLLPLLLKRWVGKMQKRAEEAFGGQYGQDFGEHHGTSDTVTDDGVHIKYTRKPAEENGSLSDELGGEYVDYEEVK